MTAAALSGIKAGAGGCGAKPRPVPGNCLGRDPYTVCARCCGTGQDLVDQFDLCALHFDSADHRLAGLAALAGTQATDSARMAAGAGCRCGGRTGLARGEIAGVALARHLGLILMLQGAVVTILGPEVSRGLLFPLAYMLFLVPMGEGLVPPLQTLTAKICMALLSLGGVPAHIEGVFITIPNGLFEVAEACSGVKFLVAMAAYGALVANVCLRSWPRRIGFMAAALTLPVFANGIRAWGTIYIAHRTNTRFAEGFDHVIYGWVFFGIVILLLMAASWRWFDRPIGGEWLNLKALRAPADARDHLLAGFVGVLALPVMAFMLSLASSAEAMRLPDAISLPDVRGWTRAAPSGDWKPNFAGADRFSHWAICRWEWAWR